MSVPSDSVFGSMRLTELIASRDSGNGVAPRLTIAIPAYNHENFVEECI